MIVGGIGTLIISMLIVFYAFTDAFPPPPLEWRSYRGPDVEESGVTWVSVRSPG